MENKVIFMTGATSGFGKFTAINTVKLGATLIVLARNKQKADALKKEIFNSESNIKGKLEFVEGNLSNFNSILTACKEIKIQYPIIDMVINNAGIMNFEHKLTVDNIEETLAVNLISPLLISHLLLDNLKRANDSKIIFTSSALHQGKINFNDLEFNDKFSSFESYRQSKLGVILITRYLDELLKDDGIHVYTQHPGIVRTDLGRNAGWLSKLIFLVMGKSSNKGAETLNYLIETPNNKLISGEYYANKKIKKTTPESYDLETSEQLINVIQSYLNNYLEHNSKIFN